MNVSGRAWLTLLLVASLLSGCGASAAEHGGALEQLRARPSSEESAARIATMAQEIRTKVSELVPGLTWTRGAPQEEQSRSLCAAPYANVPDARSISFLGGTSDRPVPDDRWAQVQAEVGLIAARYGFGTLTPVVDQPGEHDVSFHGQWGDYVDFGSVKAASFAVFGPCLLMSGAAASAPK